MILRAGFVAAQLCRHVGKKQVERRRFAAHRRGPPTHYAAGVARVDFRGRPVSRVVRRVKDVAFPGRHGDGGMLREKTGRAPSCRPSAHRRLRSRPGGRRVVRARAGPKMPRPMRPSRSGRCRAAGRGTADAPVRVSGCVPSQRRWREYADVPTLAAALPSSQPRSPTLDRPSATKQLCSCRQKPRLPMPSSVTTVHPAAIASSAGR